MFHSSLSWIEHFIMLVCMLQSHHASLISTRIIIRQHIYRYMNEYISNGYFVCYFSFKIIAGTLTLVLLLLYMRRMMPCKSMG